MSLKKIYRTQKVLFQPLLYKVDKQIKKAIGFILEFATQLQENQIGSPFHHQLSVSIMNCFLRIGPIFKKVYQTYKYILYRARNKKLKLVETPRFMSILLKQSKKGKKERGDYLRNKFSISYWAKKIK